jgi:pyruvate kinase
MEIRKARIVGTLGPSSCSKKIVEELIGSGLDVARLNFSHGEYDFHEAVFCLARREAAKQNRNISIMQDLQGIKIRVGDIEGGSMNLRQGETVSLMPGKETGGNKNVYISYPALLKDVKEGEDILFDDGIIRVRVTGKTKTALRAEVIEGGILKSRKGANLPSTRTTVDTFTEKDKKDFRFGLKLGFDYLAISFVRNADDIERVKSWAKKNRLLLPPLIAKIEKPEALKNIDDIMASVEGIMVARGDLGVEMSAQQVPVIQKMLIDCANRTGKLVITATQMLESMTHHTRPTRAEASDVANAILDGTDAVMLSAETASGKYPVESVRMMDSIIRTTEINFPDKLKSFYHSENKFAEAVALGACRAAESIEAKLIVVFTQSGFTARLLSKMRPKVPIVAFTPDQETMNRMSLYWGVMSRLISAGRGTCPEDDMLTEIERSLVKQGLIRKGNNIVFVSSSPFLGKHNVIRLQKV